MLISNLEYGAGFLFNFFQIIILIRFLFKSLFKSDIYIFSSWAGGMGFRAAYVKCMKVNLYTYRLFNYYLAQILYIPRHVRSI